VAIAGECGSVRDGAGVQKRQPVLKQNSRLRKLSNNGHHQGKRPRASHFVM
jgi:hypothetical protein